MIDRDQDGPEPSASDEVLVKRAKQGDAAAFARLHVRHQPGVYRFCKAVLRDEWDAADATQETFLIALARLYWFDEERGTFKGWLYGIARHMCMRRKRRDMVSIDEPEAQEIPDPESDRGVIEQTSDSVFVSILLRVARVVLTDNQWNAWVLVDVRQHSLKEAAETLEMPEGTVKTHVRRAREKLAEVIRNSPRFEGYAPETPTDRENRSSKAKAPDDPKAQAEEGGFDRHRNEMSDDRSDEQTIKGEPQ